MKFVPVITTEGVAPLQTGEPVKLVIVGGKIVTVTGVPLVLHPVVVLVAVTV